MNREEQQQKENFESRVETLTALFNRFIEKSRTLDGYSAILFTQPMCDMLVRAVNQLEGNNFSFSLKDVHEIKNYFGEHDATIFEHKAFSVLSRLINYLELLGINQNNEN